MMFSEKNVEACSLDYENEYWILHEKLKKLEEENEKLKAALLNLALKM